MSQDHPPPGGWPLLLCPLVGYVTEPPLCPHECRAQARTSDPDACLLAKQARDRAAAQFTPEPPTDIRPPKYASPDQLAPGIFPLDDAKRGGPMNEREIRDLFALWQRRLGLGEWYIHIEFAKLKPKTVTMRCHKSVNYQRARIQVQQWVLEGRPPKNWRSPTGVLTALDIEEAAVHELLHCVVGPIWIWEQLLDGLNDSKHHAMAARAFDKAEEGLVDKLAVALVRAWRTEGWTTLSAGERIGAGERVMTTGFHHPDSSAEIERLNRELNTIFAQRNSLSEECGRLVTVVEERTAALDAVVNTRTGPRTCRGQGARGMMSPLARRRERRTPKARMERALAKIIEREARSPLPLDLRMVDCTVNTNWSDPARFDIEIKMVGIDRNVANR